MISVFDLEREVQRVIEELRDAQVRLAQFEDARAKIEASIGEERQKIAVLEVQRRKAFDALINTARSVTETTPVVSAQALTAVAPEGMSIAQRVKALLMESPGKKYTVSDIQKLLPNVDGNSVRDTLYRLAKSASSGVSKAGPGKFIYRERASRPDGKAEGTALAVDLSELLVGIVNEQPQGSRTADIVAAAKVRTHGAVTNKQVTDRLYWLKARNRINASEDEQGWIYKPSDTYLSALEL